MSYQTHHHRPTYRTGETFCAGPHGWQPVGATGVVVPWDSEALDHVDGTAGPARYRPTGAPTMARGTSVTAPASDTSIQATPDEDETWHPGAIDASGTAPLSNTWRRSKVGRWALGDPEQDWVAIPGDRLPMPMDTRSPLARVQEPSRTMWANVPDIVPDNTTNAPHQTTPIRVVVRGYISRNVGEPIGTIGPDNLRGHVQTSQMGPHGRPELSATGAHVVWESLPDVAPTRARVAQHRGRKTRELAAWAAAIHGPDNVRRAYREAVPAGRLPAWVILAESAPEPPPTSVPVDAPSLADV